MKALNCSASRKIPLSIVSGTPRPILVTVCFTLIINLAYAPAARGQFDWTLTNPILSQAAYGNGTYVLIEPTDWIETSHDLTSWRRHHVGVYFNSVAFGNGAFIALGRNNLESDLIFRSTNGVDWVKQQRPDGRSLGQVRFLNDRFVAVGGYSDRFIGVFGMILTSFDGISWTVQYRSECVNTFCKPPALLGVAFGNDTYVAVGDAGLLESVDTRSWQETFRTPIGISDVTFGNGIYSSPLGPAARAL